MVVPFGEKDLLVTLFIGFFSTLNLALLIKGFGDIKKGLFNPLVDRISDFFGKLSYTTFMA